MKPYTVTIEAYGTAEKVVANGGNSGRVFLPKAWVGRQVKVLLLEDIEHNPHL
ncbi:MAG: DUF2080 family transposase-associated protein [Methanomicrobiaceae archaeon]|nr:DUF2080 family transposase-associated protein [Methanomicrobiaceae archaeon]